MTDLEPEPAAMLIVAGPSCSGKDSLVERLEAARPELQRPVTTTTRPPRPGEVDGRDYHFLDREAFRQRVQDGAFLEHADVHGELYGLTRDALAAVRETGAYPLVILDVQGVATVARRMPVATVFVRAPLDDLRRRIATHRPADEVEARMVSARREMQACERFDVVIDNPDGALSVAASELIAHYDDTARARLEAWSGRAVTRPGHGGR